MDFIYDNTGRPYAIVNGNATSASIYYYILNQQGDVIRILGPNNTVAATYTYNAWGEVISSSGWMAEQNPLRYRGYFQDNETGLYYLQSRYYDPSIGRFINADSCASTGQGFLGCNMFAYCLNNPVIMGDEEGMDAIVLIDDEGAFGFGHVGFLAQDDEGTWWHFYWGAQNPYISFVPWGVENAATYQEYHGPVSLDGINQSGVYSTTDSYDRLFRLSGDFSDSVEKGKVYGKNKYNLYTRNCSEVTFSLLSDAPNANQQVLKTASRVSGPKFAYQLAKNSITPPPSTRRNARNKCGGQRNLLV